jgi:folate-dependent phosphoribosylglycinamide formyltransferase PurN
MAQGEQMKANASESSWSSSPDIRVAILSSNVGGHVQALLEHRVVGQWIALVVTERPDAYALRHAQWHGVPAVALLAGKSNLDVYDNALVRLL